MPKREMPSFTKSPPELVERFRTILGAFPDVQQRPMFGYPAAFVGGNMATSLFADRWVVRLPKDEIDAAVAGDAERFEPMAGRPMTGFVVVPRADVDDDATIRRWVERGVAFAGSLPAKR